MRPRSDVGDRTSRLRDNLHSHPGCVIPSGLLRCGIDAGLCLPQERAHDHAETLKKISGYLLRNVLDRVFCLVTGKSNRHINRAYVPANHLCGMRQMASACLIADADYPGTSWRTRGDVPGSNQDFKSLLRACGFHKGAGPLGGARHVQDDLYRASQHFGSAALREPRTNRISAGRRGILCRERKAEKNRGGQQHTTHPLSLSLRSRQRVLLEYLAAFLQNVQLVHVEVLELVDLPAEPADFD